MFFYLYIPEIPIRFCYSFTDSIITITKIHAIPTRSIVVMIVPSHNTEKSVAETGSTLEIMLARTGPMSCTPCRNNKNDIIVPIPPARLHFYKKGPICFGPCNLLFVLL